MKILKAVIFSCFILGIYSAVANSCETQLLEQLSQDQNLKIVKIIDTYSCNHENSCAVLFENDNRPYSNSVVLAYLDVNNKLHVSWSPVRDQIASGWELSGHHVCADVKTYLDADLSDENLIQINISKEAARDAMFCPFGKKYISYKTTCTKN